MDRPKESKMKTLICLVLATVSGVASAQALPDAPKPKFFTKTNIALFSTDFLVRALDAESTNANLSNPCKCYKENNIAYVTSKGPAATYGYSLGVSGAIMAGSFLLHRKHYDRLSHLLPMIDIAYDGHSMIQNYEIAGKHAAVTPRVAQRTGK